MSLYKFLWRDMFAPSGVETSSGFGAGELGEPDYYYLHCLPRTRQLVVFAASTARAMEAAAAFLRDDVADLRRPDSYESPHPAAPAPPDWADPRPEPCPECKGAGRVMTAGRWYDCGLCASRRRMNP